MNIKNRKNILIINTISSLIYQLLAVVCGFILPRFFLQYYGSEVNGLIASITQFLSFIVLMELGIGAVVQSSLYKPLAIGDHKEISRIVKSAQQFFNKIAAVFLIYLSLLIVLYPSLNNTFSWAYTASLIVIIAISSIAQYFFGITYQLLLFADQKSYVPQFISIIVLILYTILSILMIINGASIHIVKLMAAIIFLIRPFLLNIYAKNNYQIVNDIQITEEPIKQKWNGIAQHLASFVLSNTDIVILSIFSSLTNISIYAVYNLVVTGVKQFITALIGGVQSLFGTMLANNEYADLRRRFLQFEWMLHTIVTLLFSCTAILIAPFVNVYTQGIIDANYNQPLFGILLTFSAAAYCLRLPYNIMVLAAGHYKQTQASAIIEMSINLVLSILLVSRFGIIGVAIGTLVSMTYRTIYLAYYLSHNIIDYNFNSFVKHVMIDLITVSIIFGITSNLNLRDINYLSWLMLGSKVFCVAVLTITIVNIFFYKDYALNSINILRGKLIHRER